MHETNKSIARRRHCNCLRALHSFACPGANYRSRRRTKCKAVNVEHIKIHGTALEGNLEGDAVDRDVIVLLPPSYEKDKKRHYPVIYALHGYSIGAEQWSHEIHVPQTVEGAFAKGSQEMIVGATRFENHLQRLDVFELRYHRDFEKFIAHDVVSYIDAHYRSIPNRNSRGLCRPLYGRLWRVAHRNETSRCLRSTLHHESCCLSSMAGGALAPLIRSRNGP